MGLIPSTGMELGRATESQTNAKVFTVRALEYQSVTRITYNMRLPLI